MLIADLGISQKARPETVWPKYLAVVEAYCETWSLVNADL
jgi:hypothetical protein